MVLIRSISKRDCVSISKFDNYLNNPFQLLLRGAVFLAVLKIFEVFSEKFQKSLAIDRKICYNIAKIKSIILIKSSVVTGTMMLQQPAEA